MNWPQVTDAEARCCSANRGELVDQDGDFP